MWVNYRQQKSMQLMASGRRGAHLQQVFMLQHFMKEKEKAKKYKVQTCSLKPIVVRANPMIRSLPITRAHWEIHINHSRDKFADLKFCWCRQTLLPTIGSEATPHYGQMSVVKVTAAEKGSGHQHHKGPSLTLPESSQRPHGRRQPPG